MGAVSARTFSTKPAGASKPGRVTPWCWPPVAPAAPGTPGRGKSGAAESRNFLLTEALRGEGAYLRLPDGTRFMPNYHPDAELAPRDVVARSIDAEMKR